MPLYEYQCAQCGQRIEILQKFSDPPYSHCPKCGGEARRETLEAAKEAKYREIRDAELDHRMGKLSDSDYRETDRELRRQAIEILRELDELEPVEGDGRR